MTRGIKVRNKGKEDKLCEESQKHIHITETDE